MEEQQEEEEAVEKCRRKKEHDACNSGEFSRNCAHVVLAGTLPPPIRPGSILRLTQQRISPTRQRILLLVTVSEYRSAAIFSGDEYTARIRWVVAVAILLERVHLRVFIWTTTAFPRWLSIVARPFSPVGGHVSVRNGNGFNPFAVPLCSTRVACQILFNVLKPRHV